MRTSLHLQDDHLMIHFNQGCEKAFRQVYDHFNDFLFLFAKKNTRDGDIAHDIVVELFVKLWERRVDFNSMGAVKRFLFISARNACINHAIQRKNRDRIKKEMLLLAESEEECVLNKMIRDEEFSEIYMLIENLPDKCRTVFVKSFIAGKKVCEIAAEMGVSIHTIRNQKARAKNLLGQQFR